MSRILLLLMLAFGVVAGAVAQSSTGPAEPAATSTNAYAATVPVSGTSDGQRNAAISEALAEVVAQVAPGLTATPEQLAHASGYVRNFRYQRAASGGLELQVDFDPGAIRRVVADARDRVAGTVAGQVTPGGSAPGASAGGASGAGSVWVAGVDGEHAYASLLSLLRGDPALSDVVPVAAEGDGVLLRLESDRPLALVLSQLGGPSGHLEPVAQPHPGADATMRWIP